MIKLWAFFLIVFNLGVLISSSELIKPSDYLVIKDSNRDYEKAIATAEEVLLVRSTGLENGVLVGQVLDRWSADGNVSKIGRADEIRFVPRRPRYATWKWYGTDKIKLHFRFSGPKHVDLCIVKFNNEEQGETQYAVWHGSEFVRERFDLISRLMKLDTVDELQKFAEAQNWKMEALVFSAYLRHAIRKSDGKMLWTKALTKALRHHNMALREGALDSVRSWRKKWKVVEDKGLALAISEALVRETKLMDQHPMEIVEMMDVVLGSWPQEERVGEQWLAVANELRKASVRIFDNPRLSENDAQKLRDILTGL